MPDMEYQADPFTEPVTKLLDLIEERMTLRQRIPILDKEIREAVLKEYDCGTSISTIAAWCGVSPQRIRSIVGAFRV